MVMGPGGGTFKRNNLVTVFMVFDSRRVGEKEVASKVTHWMIRLQVVGSASKWMSQGHEMQKGMYGCVRGALLSVGGQGRSLWGFWAKTWKMREGRTQKGLRKEHSRQKEKEGKILNSCHQVVFLKWHFCCICKLSVFISVPPIVCLVFWETLCEIISKFSLLHHSFIRWMSPGKVSVCIQQRIWRKSRGPGPWPQDLPLHSFPNISFSLSLFLFRVKEQGPKHQSVLVLFFHHMPPSTLFISQLPRPSESREEEQKRGDKEGLEYH